MDDKFIKSMVPIGIFFVAAMTFLVVSHNLGWWNQ